MKALICYSGNIRNSKNHIVINGKSICGCRLKEPIVIVKSINLDDCFLLKQDDCGKCFKQLLKLQQYEKR